MNVNEQQKIVKNPDASELEKQKLLKDVEKAKKAQARLLDERKKAPKGVKFDPFASDPLDDAVKRLVPKAMPSLDLTPETRQIGEFAQGATEQAAWFTKDKHRDALFQGFEPVIEDGEHYMVGDVGLYKRPIVFKRDKVRSIGRMSKERMKISSTEFEEAKAKGGKNVEDEIEITN